MEPGFGFLDFCELRLSDYFSLLDCGGMEQRRPCSVVKELRLPGSRKWLKDLFSPLFEVLLWINKFWVRVIDFG